MNGSDTPAAGSSASGRSTHLVGLLERLADIGARPGDPQDERLRAGALILATAGIATISFAWVITYLLLDEPLSALDTHTRGVVRGELAEVLAELRLPTLIVTHDFEDAAALAGRVGVIVEGRILQLGPAAELLAAPADGFVASFTGANLLRGTARPGADGLTEVVLDSGGSAFSTDHAEGRVGLAVYPWEVALGRAESVDSAVNHVRGEVRSLVTLGNRVRVRVGPLWAELTASSAERLGVAPGEHLVASFKATGARLVPLGDYPPRRDDAP